MSTDVAGAISPDRPDLGKLRRLALGAMVGGLGAYIVLGVVNYSIAPGGTPADFAVMQFFLSYLVGFIFWFSLPLGGMSLLFIHYLSKTSWGILLQRPLEAATRTLPVMGALFLVVILGLIYGAPALYVWVNPSSSLSGEELEEHTRRVEDIYGFLTTRGFILVSALCFMIWFSLIHYLNKWSRDAEAATDREGVEASLEKLKNISGPGMIIYAITITAAATLWVMSLELHWASTMFPVIFAVNQFLTCFAFCLALFLLLAGKPPLKDVLRDKFQIDMGTLMLAFTLLWSYTSFSQLMLVYIGNLPEEIPFFLKRSAGAWWWVSFALIFFHFLLPFLLLLFRDIKKNPVALRGVATYLLVICFIDVSWWIEPSYPHEGQYLYWLMDVAAVIGIGGVWGLEFLRQLGKRSLLPVNETYLLPKGHDHGH